MRFLLASRHTLLNLLIMLDDSKPYLVSCSLHTGKDLRWMQDRTSSIEANSAAIVHAQNGNEYNCYREEGNGLQS